MATRSIHETDQDTAIYILEGKIAIVEKELDRTRSHDRSLKLNELNKFYHYLLRVVARCPVECLPAMMLDASVEI